MAQSGQFAKKDDYLWTCGSKSIAQKHLLHIPDITLTDHGDALKNSNSDITLTDHGDALKNSNSYK